MDNMLVRIKHNAGNIYAHEYLRNCGGDHQSAMLASQLSHWLNDHVGEVWEVHGPIRKENTIYLDDNVSMSFIPDYCLECV
jgi:hypothetical protein